MLVIERAVSHFFTYTFTRKLVEDKAKNYIHTIREDCSQKKKILITFKNATFYKIQILWKCHRVNIIENQIEQQEIRWDTNIESSIYSCLICLVSNELKTWYNPYIFIMSNNVFSVGHSVQLGMWQLLHPIYWNIRMSKLSTLIYLFYFTFKIDFLNKNNFLLSLKIYTLSFYVISRFSSYCHFLTVLC